MTETTIGGSVASRMEEALLLLHATKSELAAAMEKADGSGYGISSTAVGALFGPGQRRPETMERIVAALNTMAERRGMARRWSVAELLGEAPTTPALPEFQDAMISPVAQRVAELLAGTRGIEIERDLSYTSVRSFAAVPCGTPVVCGDEYEMVDVPTKDLPRGWNDKCFTAPASGDSMVGLGITAGSRLFIDPDAVPDDRDVVVVILDGETTCKRYRRYGQRAVLKAANPDHPDIEVTGRNELVIVGVVVLVSPPSFRP